MKNTGGLPELQAVASGVARMKRWAKQQGLENADIATVTDTEGEPVSAQRVFAAVEAFVNAGIYEQLLVYYAGHGVNNGLAEYWLLSAAPANPNEAINVAGSVRLAENVQIPHVVLISDACRTAPEGIQALAVTGSEMFPNLVPMGAPATVDVFYACRLGDPAHEIRDPDASSRVYRSLYTEVLIDALNGKYVDVLETVENPTEKFDVVRPWPLNDHLGSYVLQELKNNNLWLEVSQEPHARVTSNPRTAWLSKLESVAARSGGPTRGPATLATEATGRLTRAITAAPDPGVPTPALDGSDLLERGAATLVEEFGPRHYETGAGFKIRGDSFADAFSPDAGFDEVHPERVRATVTTLHPAANIALRFRSGSCVLLPAIRQYICALSFDAGQLVDVAYEPMDTSFRWDDYQVRKEEIRRAHAAAASAARVGVLSPNADEATEMAQYYQSLKGLDPAFALYAAYAHDDLGKKSRISEMDGYMQDDLGMSFFDVRLLGRGNVEERLPEQGVFPSLPMMSRGWAIASALGMPDRLGLSASRLPSLWTLYADSAFDRLRQWLTEGEI